MVLTNRDREVLKLISKMSLLSTSQLNRTVFKKIAITTQLRRLRVLESAGYLQRIAGFESAELAWSLTKKGALAIDYSSSKRKFNRANLVHDLKLVDLRLILEGSGCAQSWIPEHEIRSKMAKRHGHRQMQSQTVPDGIMGIEHKGLKESVAIELELNYKNQKRYRDIFLSYRYKGSLHAVWYVVDSAPFGKYLSDLWINHVGHTKQPFFVWALVEDILANAMAAELHCDDSIQKLGEVWTPKRSGLPAHTPAQPVSRQLDEKCEIQNDVSPDIKSELLAS